MLLEGHLNEYEHAMEFDGLLCCRWQIRYLIEALEAESWSCGNVCIVCMFLVGRAGVGQMKGCFEKSQEPVVVFRIIKQRTPLMLFARELESIHSALSQ